ncbi:hypothetical protein GCM10027168_45560 [Streptomyces capparidis]
MAVVSAVSADKDVPEGQLSTADRVCILLTTLSGLGPGWHRLERLMAASKLPRTTVRRLLGTLAEHGLVRHDPVVGYSLPPAEQPLPVLPPLATACQALLATLQYRTGQTVLCHGCLVPPGHTPLRVCLDYRLGGGFLHGLSDVERHEAIERLRQAPLHLDAPGQVIAAYREDGNRFVGTRWREIRGRGFTRSQSPVAGWDLLAAPVQAQGAVVGALSIAARRDDMTRHLSQYVQQLTDAARRLSSTQARAVPLAATTGPWPAPAGPHPGSTARVSC